MQQQWPLLSYQKGKETFETLHLCTQIVGKIKLAILPWINHSWHVTLQPDIRGLTTGPMPYRDFHFQIDFDFTDHQLYVHTSRKSQKGFSLLSLSVADFYRKTLGILNDLNIHVEINPMPCEIANPVSFPEDDQHRTYDPDEVTAFHHALLTTRDVLLTFRSGFKGKCSPIHFFWGSFDLALSFFSGRPAPKHPGGVPGLPDWVAAEAYNREVSSCGFWPGSEAYPHAAFYCYLYPEPEGYKDIPNLPKDAFYHPDLREFILPYEAVRQAPDGSFLLLDFLTSTLRGGATLADWDKSLF